VSSTQDSPIRRLGFHYYPDTLHFQAQDLERWVPELLRMDASWLTLLAPVERAIPEYFIEGLVANGIQPILHYQLPLRPSASHDTFRLLLRQYARWGVRWVSFFDSPNSRRSWDGSDWAQTDLVERFLDLFLPLAQAAVDEGLTPALPPFEPGGDYWDLSFLQDSLRGLVRRSRNALLDKLALGAYAWTGSRPLDWGIGGPERWPESRPYHPSVRSEDHLGFRIFDWYSAVSREELSREVPILLLRGGSLPVDSVDPHTGHLDLNIHTQTNLSIAQLLEVEADNDPGAAPQNVVCCCFWLLCAGETRPCTEQAWFGKGDEPLPVVSAFYRWGARKARIGLETDPEPPVELPIENEPPSQLVSPASVEAADLGVDAEDEGSPSLEEHQYAALEEDGALEEQSDSEYQTLLGKFLEHSQKPEEEARAISHYVLLPLYAWGVAEWDIASIQPLIEDAHPTIGFSLAEARLAARVTVVGGAGAISDEALAMLRSSGCKVDRVLEDGTLVAP